MKKTFFILLSIISLGAIAQSKLKYSGLFDSYYTTGPLKYYVEPGVTIMNGELAKSTVSFGGGAGINYRVLPAVYLNSSLRYLSFNSKDHVSQRGYSHKGTFLQLTSIANYHFVYDVIRKSYQRRRGQKKMNAYVLFGLSFNVRYNIETMSAGEKRFQTAREDDSGNIFDLFDKRSQVLHFPLGLGFPIRITPRFTITPEIATYFTALPFIQNGSDKLDGIVYNGGDKQYNDSYTFINIKFMFNPKGKRLHKKQPQATNGDVSGEAGGNYSDYDDSDSSSGDSNNGSNETNTNEQNTNTEDNNEGSSDDSNDEGKKAPSEEEDGPKYDDDGFLIDE